LIGRKADVLYFNANKMLPFQAFRKDGNVLSRINPF